MMLTVGGPGFPFVDANNDGLFNAGDGDVLLNNGELSDGKFDTAVAEGPNYTTPVAGAGLVIDGAAITVTGNINYKASGTLIVNTNLTAGDDLKLTSRTASVKLDDPTLTATDDIIIVARVDITGLSDTLSAGGDIYALAGGNIFLVTCTITGGRGIEMYAGGFIELGDSTTTATNGEIDLKAIGDVNSVGGTLSAIGSHGEVELWSGNFINVSTAQIHAKKEIELFAANTIFIDGATLQTTGSEIDIATRANIVGAGSTIDAQGSRGEVYIAARGAIDLTDATVTAAKQIDIHTRDAVFAQGAFLLAANWDVNIEARLNVDLSASANRAAVIRAFKDIYIESKTADVDIRGASIASLTGSTKGEIKIKAADELFVEGAEILYAKKLKLQGTQVGTPLNVAQGTLPLPV